jgi:biopolymer transport protein ExbB
LVCGFLALAAGAAAGGGDDSGRIDPAAEHAAHAHGWRSASPADGVASAFEPLEMLAGRLRWTGSTFLVWYRRTPPAERVTWGGLAACAGLGVLVLLERLAGLRRRKIVPADFTARFLDRLNDGRLDCGQALDHCELNPSPAARVALAAVRRWGRPPSDLERAVTLAHRLEADRLRRNVGTLRRIGALAPLVGLLGTLFAAGRVLQTMPSSAPVTVSSAGAATLGGTAIEPVAAWGPALAAALTPLCTGVAIAILALVAYDGLLIRIEKLAGALDRLGAETIDAIAMAAPVFAPISTFAGGQPRAPVSRTDPPVGGPQSHPRGPHQAHLRVEDRRDTISRAGQNDGGF